MKITIKRIGILSAAKIGCLMSILPLILIALLFSASSVFFGARSTLGSISAVMGPTVLIYGLIAAIGSAIFWAMQAILYNVAAWLFGGIEFTLKRNGPVQQPLRNDVSPAYRPIQAQFPDEIEREQYLAKQPTPYYARNETERAIILHQKRIAEHQQKLEQLLEKYKFS